MNDDFLPLLDAALTSVGAEPDLTDAEVDAFLSQPVECNDAALERIYRRFIEKVLRELNESPVTEVEGIPFGRWIEQTRITAHLSSEFVEAALAKRAPFLQRLETGVLLPWKLPAAEIAKIAELFRIHVKALRQMVAASLKVSQAPLTGEVFARSRGGKVSQERGDSTKKALDLFLARNAKQANFDPAIEEWLQAVTESLAVSEHLHLVQ